MPISLFSIQSKREDSSHAHRLHYRFAYLAQDAEHIRDLISEDSIWVAMQNQDLVEHVTSHMEHFIQDVRALGELTLSFLLEEYPKCIKTQSYRSYPTKQEFYTFVNNQPYHKHSESRDEANACKWDELPLKKLLNDEDLSIVEAFQPFWNINGKHKAVSKKNALHVIKFMNNYAKHESFLGLAPAEYIQKNWKPNKKHPRVKKDVVLGLEYGTLTDENMPIEYFLQEVQHRYSMALIYVIPKLSVKKDKIYNHWNFQYEFVMHKKNPIRIERKKSMTEVILSNVTQILKNQNLNSEGLLEALERNGVTASTNDLMRMGRSLGMGLARDGKWYLADQNTEVNEAIKKNTITFLMEQYLRNRH